MRLSCSRNHVRRLFQEWAGVNGLVRLSCSKNGPGSMTSAPVREVPNLRCQTEKENEHSYYCGIVLFFHIMACLMVSGITRDTGYVVQPSKDPLVDGCNELSAQESPSLCIVSVNSCLRINADESDALKHPLPQPFRNPQSRDTVRLSPPHTEPHSTARFREQCRHVKTCLLLHASLPVCQLVLLGCSANRFALFLNGLSSPH